MKDNLVKDLINKNINMAVPLYLMMSYSYYKLDDPIASDECFDETAKIILANWDKIEHRHKKHLNKESLLAGTYLGVYPTIVEGAVQSFRKIGPLGI